MALETAVISKEKVKLTYLFAFETLSIMHFKL